MIILGVDPGTATTGYGVVRHAASRVGGDAVMLVECGVIRTPARAVLAERLREIHEGIRELIARHAPDVVAVESAFYAKNVRTTMTLSHTRGVILLAAAQARCTVREMAPREIKKAVVGNGNASKEQVQFMVTRLLRLRSAPRPADAADGVAAALACGLGAGVEASIAAALR